MRSIFKVKSVSDSQFSRGLRAVFIGVLLAVIPAAGQDVLTQHNDNQRTGANLNETRLTREAVKKNFGLLYTREVKGYIYAQPLYIRGVDVATEKIKKAGANLVIVATGENRIYAFDADDTGKNAGALWDIKLPEPAGIPSAFNLCPLTIWPVGITSTPVIDPAAQKIYVVARNNTTGAHWLHVIDLKDGREHTAAVEIKYDTVRAGGPEITFNAELHLNRPGLLLANGKIFIAFGSMCDLGNSHGWVFSYDASTLEQKDVFCTSPRDRATNVSGGIWQSGNGLTADQAGNYIYLMTGNGAFDVSEKSFGSSFLQLRADDLKPAGYFAPNNQEELSIGDVDVGSGGPVLLGDKLIGGGKEGRYYILDPIKKENETDAPVKIEPAQNSAASTADKIEGFQAFVNTYHDPLPNAKNSGRIFSPVWANVERRQISQKKQSGFLLCKQPDFSKPCPFPQVEDENNVFDVLCARGYALQKGLVIPRKCYAFNQYYGPNIHGGPLYWKGREIIYGTAEKDAIRSYRFYPNGKTTSTAAEKIFVDFADPLPKSEITAPDGMPGGFLSLSANGERDGIIWATFPKTDNTFFIQPGRIVAFDAETMEKIWSDDKSAAGFTKFCPPTVADGKVFRTSFMPNLPMPVLLPVISPFDKGQLMVYGECQTAREKNRCIDSRKTCWFSNLFHKAFN